MSNHNNSLSMESVNQLRLRVVIDTRVRTCRNRYGLNRYSRLCVKHLGEYVEKNCHWPPHWGVEIFKLIYTFLPQISQLNKCRKLQVGDIFWHSPGKGEEIEKYQKYIVLGKHPKEHVLKVMTFKGKWFNTIEILTEKEYANVRELANI